MNKEKKKEKNLYKIFVIVLSVVLALVCIANIVYFFYIKNQQKEKEAILSNAVDTAIEECMTNLQEFGMTEEQEKYIELYKTNMENSTTTLQRAYIAETMLTYAVNSTDTINSEKIADIYQNGGITQSKQYIADDLRATEQTLRAAIYEYTLFDEDK